MRFPYYCTVERIERILVALYRNAADYPMPTVYHLTLLLDKIKFINPIELQEKFSQVQNKRIKAQIALYVNVY